MVDEIDKNAKLHDIILNLGENDFKIDDSNVQDIIDNLCKIYSDGFRHYYSRIFADIAFIDDNPNYKLERLSSNIGIIHDVFEKLDEEQYDENIKEKIKKLYDHVNLDISRIDYTSQVSDKLNKKNIALSNKLFGLSKRIFDIDRKSESMQKNYIAILGIFASIIITFVAGMVFSSSVLSNIDKASIYRLVFIMIMIALMLFNLLRLLLDFIQKVAHSNLELNKTTNKQRNSVITNINIILFFMLICDIGAWGFYWYRAMHPAGWFPL